MSAHQQKLWEVSPVVQAGRRNIEQHKDGSEGYSEPNLEKWP